MHDPHKLSQKPGQLRPISPAEMRTPVPFVFHIRKTRRALDVGSFEAPAQELLQVHGVVFDRGGSQPLAPRILMQPEVQVG